MLIVAWRNPQPLVFNDTHVADKEKYESGQKNGGLKVSDLKTCNLSCSLVYEDQEWEIMREGKLIFATICLWIVMYWLLCLHLAGPMKTVSSGQDLI